MTYAGSFEMSDVPGGALIVLGGVVGLAALAIGALMVGLMARRRAGRALVAVGAVLLAGSMLAALLATWGLMPARPVAIVYNRTAVGLAMAPGLVVPACSDRALTQDAVDRAAAAYVNATDDALGPGRGRQRGHERPGRSPSYAGRAVLACGAGRGRPVGQLWSGRDREPAGMRRPAEHPVATSHVGPAMGGLK
jgi:hypothetical protein